MYRDLIFYDMDVYGTSPRDCGCMLTRTSSETRTPMAQKLSALCNLVRNPEKGQMALPRLQQITSMSRFLAQKT